jgi:hypothetical protein
MSLQVVFSLEAIVALRTLEWSFVLVHGLNMSSKFRRLCKGLSACDADGSRSCLFFSIVKLLVYFLWVLRYLKRVVGSE